MVPETLDEFYVSGFYARDSRKVRAANALTNASPAVFAGPQLTVVADVESSLKDVFEAPLDKDLTGNEVPARSFFPHTYKSEHF